MRVVREPDLGRLTDKGVAAAAVGIAIIGLAELVLSLFCSWEWEIGAREGSREPV